MVDLGDNDPEIPRVFLSLAEDSGSQVSSHGMWVFGAFTLVAQNRSEREKETDREKQRETGNKGRRTARDCLKASNSCLGSVLSME